MRTRIPENMSQNDEIDRLVEKRIKSYFSKPLTLFILTNFIVIFGFIGAILHSLFNVVPVVTEQVANRHVQEHAQARSETLDHLVETTLTEMVDLRSKYRGLNADLAALNAALANDLNAYDEQKARIAKFDEDTVFFEKTIQSLERELESYRTTIESANNSDIFIAAREILSASQYKDLAQVLARIDAISDLQVELRQATESVFSLADQLATSDEEDRINISLDAKVVQIRPEEIGPLQPDPKVFRNETELGFHHVCFPTNTTQESEGKVCSCSTIRRQSSEDQWNTAVAWKGVSMAALRRRFAEDGITSDPCHCEFTCVNYGISSN